MIQNDSEIKTIVEAIRRLYHVVYQNGIQTSRRYGLTRSQSAAMRILAKFGPLSSADLSRKLHVTPSNITGVIDRLEKKRLVERVRDRGDRRIALITLTETGLVLGQTLPDPIEDKLVSRLGHLGPEEISEYRLSIARILDLIDDRKAPEKMTKDR
jgi:DNA-binding MarR family transcriptional regulator